MFAVADVQLAELGYATCCHDYFWIAGFVLPEL
jgi:hypothetical protein